VSWGPGGTDESIVRPVRVWAGEQDINEPNQIHLKHIVAISAGWDHSMALEKDDPNEPNLTGRVYAWGNNENTIESHGGRLGNGTTTSSGVPVMVLSGEQEPNDANSPLEHIVAVSAGEGQSMALDANGYVYCWGDNQYGELGNGLTADSTTAVRVIAGRQNPGDPNSPLSNIVAISAGYWHCLAIDANGVIWTWGKGSSGQLGLANKTINCNTPHPIPVVYNVTQETFHFGIQAAIDDANDAGDTLEASPGTYYENVNFRDKSVTLKSEDPNDWGVVAATIIDGQYNSGSDAQFAAVDFNGGSGSTVAGLTLWNAPGAGVFCKDVDSVTIMNCSIENNEADGIYVDGSSVDITHCIIQDNGSSSRLPYCGIYCDDAATTAINITNNWISGNGTGGTGSGIYLNSSHVDLEDVVIRHNTIANNAGYGIETSGIPDINNCIIWGNDSGALEANDYNVTYSCIEGGYTGTGNIDSDPCFVDDVNDDYHLTWASNCVDWGDPNFVEDANETDIDGNPRIMGGAGGYGGG